MKINKKILYSFLSLSAITTIPIAAISCNNGNEANNDKNIANKNFDNFYMFKHSGVYYISSVPGFAKTSSDIENNKKINSEIKEYLNNYLQKKEASKIKYKNTNSLVIDKDKITGFDSIIDIKLNNKIFQLKANDDSSTFSNLDTNQDYFKPRSNGTTGNIPNVINNYGVSYSLYYKNTIVASISQLIISLVKNTTVSPSFLEEQEKITPDYVKNTLSKKFVPFDFDFNDSKSNYYNNSFEAKVISVADGDTITVSPMVTKNINGVFDVAPTDKITIRLAGIDTPEKAVGRGATAQTSSLFEYDFAYMSTKFAEALFPVGQKVMIAFAGNKDAYGRVVADVFFNLNDNGKYPYSYSAEITRAGYTLPFGEEGYSQDLKNDTSNHSYIRMVYPEIADAMYQAQSENVGYYQYFHLFSNISNYVYGLKRNSKYTIFENVYKIYHQNDKK